MTRHHRLLISVIMFVEVVVEEYHEQAGNGQYPSCDKQGSILNKTSMDCKTDS